MANLPSSAETKSFADDHLLYEIQMVAGLTRRLSAFRELLETEPSPGDVTQQELFDLAGRNADIEAFAVHTRVLVDFLYSDKRKQNDAIAGDFFGDTSWPTLRPEKTPALKRVNTRVGKEIAHLSYRRATPAQTWSYEEIWRDLSDVLRVFLENAAQDCLTAKFRESVRAILPAPRDASSLAHLAALRATEYPGPVLFEGELPGTATSADLPEPPPYE